MGSIKVSWESNSLQTKSTFHNLENGSKELNNHGVCTLDLRESQSATPMVIEFHEIVRKSTKMVLRALIMMNYSYLPCTKYVACNFSDETQILLLLLFALKSLGCFENIVWFYLLYRKVFDVNIL